MHVDESLPLGVNKNFVDGSSKGNLWPSGLEESKRMRSATYLLSFSEPTNLVGSNRAQNLQIKEAYTYLPYATSDGATGGRF